VTRPSGGILVSISPPSAAVPLGCSQQFTATVSGSSDTAVTWSMSPALGTLSSSGYYTAPTNLTNNQTVTITATSVADPTSSASAAVMVPGRHRISRPLIFEEHVGHIPVLGVGTIVSNRFQNKSFGLPFFKHCTDR
jgi:hypothetical protein